MTSFGTRSHNALLCNTCPRKEDGKGDEIGVEKKAKHQNLLQMLGDSSAALLVIASPLLIMYIDKDIFGDLLCDGCIGLNAFNNSINDLLLV